MNDFNEALRNIDVFCKVLVKKIVENEVSNNIILEPIENLLHKKYIEKEKLEPSPSVKHLIPLAHVEEPLIDIVDAENYVQVLMQSQCKSQNVAIHTDTDGLEICKRECHTDAQGVEMCTDKCQKLNLSTKQLKIEDMTAKCNNNTVLEINIPKTKTKQH